MVFFAAEVTDTENIAICFNAVAPMFIIMAAGYVARLAGLVREDDVTRINSISFRAFMPCLIFKNLYTSDFSSAVNPQVIIFAVCSVLAVFGLSLLAVMLTARTPGDRGVMVQGIFRSNYVAIGIPIATALLPDGDLGVVALLIGVVVPIYNVLAVVTLEAFRGGRPRLGPVLKGIALNPLIIGSALGLLAVGLKIKLPSVLESAISQIGNAATPLQIFVLGSFFKFSGLGKYARQLTFVTVGKLVAVPALTLTAAYLLGLRGAEFVAIVACFTTATAMASFPMAQQMGGNAVLAGDIVVLTSAVCPLTIFAWSLLFKTLGAF